MAQIQWSDWSRSNTWLCVYSWYSTAIFNRQLVVKGNAFWQVLCQISIHWYNIIAIKHPQEWYTTRFWPVQLHIRTRYRSCVYVMNWSNLVVYHPWGCCIEIWRKTCQNVFSLATSCLWNIAVLYHEYTHSHKMPLDQSDHWICTINTRI